MPKTLAGIRTQGSIKAAHILLSTSNDTPVLEHNRYNISPQFVKSVD